jgi:hypothetical protein
VVQQAPFSSFAGLMLLSYYDEKGDKKISSRAIRRAPSNESYFFSGGGASGGEETV